MYQKDRIQYKYEIALLAALAVYFFFGKLRIFHVFRISTDYLFWLVLVVCAVGVALLRERIRCDSRLLPFVVYLVYLFLEMFRSEYSYYAVVFFGFNVIVFCIFWLLLGKQGLAEVEMKIFYWGGLYYAVTVILQYLFPNLINPLRVRLLSGLDYEITQKGYENTRNYLGGLSTNSGVAAFYIGIFVVIAAAGVMSGRKKGRNLFLACFGVIALYLTKKRTLFLGTALAVMGVCFLYKKDTRRKKILLAGGTVLGIISLCLIMLTGMDFGKLWEKVSGSLESLWVRQDMYHVMLQWFYMDPFLGAGIGTAQGVWGYGGHNCYLQLLGETGMVGCILYACVVVPRIVKSGKMLRTVWNREKWNKEQSKVLEILITDNACIFLILIYALTGNPFYDYSLCLTFFIMLVLPTQISLEEYV